MLLCSALDGPAYTTRTTDAQRSSPASGKDRTASPRSSTRTPYACTTREHKLPIQRQSTSTFSNTTLSTRTPKRGQSIPTATPSKRTTTNKSTRLTESSNTATNTTNDNTSSSGAATRTEATLGSTPHRSTPTNSYKTTTANWIWQHVNRHHTSDRQQPYRRDDRPAPRKGGDGHRRGECNVSGASRHAAATYSLPAKRPDKRATPQRGKTVFYTTSHASCLLHSSCTRASRLYRWSTTV